MPKYGQPVISRETRLLLITIVVSVGALWLLARLRFQDRPAAVAPVAPVLAQLRPQSSYDDLARSLSNLRPAVSAAIVPAVNGEAALRVGNELGIALAGEGLALVRLPAGDVPATMAWTPRIFDYPRYLIAADLLDATVSLRPMFVGALVPALSPGWQGAIWRLPPGLNLRPGTFVFTTEGLLAGVAVEHAGSLSLVPGQLVLNAAERLSQEIPRVPGHLGLAVQSTPLGLAVAWVDPHGPAADELAPTDIIETLNGQPVASVEDWRARMRQVGSGEEVALRVKSEGETRDVSIVAAALVAPGEDPSLGLRMRPVPRTGVEVLGVEPRSRADRAGFRQGDLITVFGPEKAPTPAQVTRTFDGMAFGGKVLAAVTRGEGHQVMVVEKNVRERADAAAGAAAR